MLSITSFWTASVRDPEYVKLSRSRILSPLSTLHTTVELCAIMPPDRLLATVLRAYQEPSSSEQTNRILSTTTSLLTTLANPLNITLLTSQLLTAPAVWQHIEGLKTSLRIISVYNTAALTVRKYQLDNPEKHYDAYQPRTGGGLDCDEWAKAVIAGLDDRSPRWMHTLVISGIFLGMGSGGFQGLSPALKTKLEFAIVTAANLALESANDQSTLNSTILALNHSFAHLSEVARRDLNHEFVGRHAIDAMIGVDGYHNAYFLDTIDYDVRQQIQGNQFDWPANSGSFLQLRALMSKPLLQTIGPLAKLLAYTIEHMRDPAQVLRIREQLHEFTVHLLGRWQRNKLSEIDASEESTYLGPETLQSTYPVLWQVMKTAMFSSVVVLQAIISRTLIDRTLSSPQHAPTTATKALSTLRNIHFISSRLGSNAFSAYTFVNMTSIDILTRYSEQATQFLTSIHPTHSGRIPEHPLDRNLDLFYLNIAEHFTLTISPTSNESLIATVASPYLNPTANAHLLEIFEAAHSAMLAIFAAPQNAVLTAQILPFYIDSLFNSFPTNLSPRQFRFAFKSLIQISTPPSPLSISHSEVAETLLDLLHHRALTASQTPLSPSVALKSQADADSLSNAPLLSEQAILLLTLLDSLPFVTLEVLENWLPLTAELLWKVKDEDMREHCKQRFWELLMSGEMDVDRSAVCVGWWGTRGGREMVLFGKDGYGTQGEKDVYMSGALPIRDSRL